MTRIKSDDELLINNLLIQIPEISKNEAEIIAKDYPPAEERIKSLNFVYPFDENIKQKMAELLPLGSNEDLYRKVEDLKLLWELLLDKSIKCLRFFDEREPYLTIKEKEPQSYGLDRLILYYDEFAQFEALLYGSNQFYRDHVIHLFRSWLIGMNILVSQPRDGRLYKLFSFEGVPTIEFNFNYFECLSMWTIASLCHDLGYPLEKFQEIINKTQKMMEYLVSRPQIHQDITFSGTQDKLNDNIIRLISSKMKVKANDSKQKHSYQARTQSKYLMKYTKSLEDYKHGIISAIIIYKALLYFLESDFSIHDDYIFEHNDARQFYLRRDILRSISSHTCQDTYHLHSTTFPFLLIISDELQEWGRKRWQNIYKSGKMDTANFSLAEYNQNEIVIEYEFENIFTKQVCILIESFYLQFKKYRMLFRDGQDTKNRSFSFYVSYLIKLRSKKQIMVTVMIPSETAAKFKISSKDYTREGDFKNVLGNKICSWGTISTEPEKISLYIN